jgi:hypothetical protein
VHAWRKTHDEFPERGMREKRERSDHAFKSKGSLMHRSERFSLTTICTVVAKRAYMDRAFRVYSHRCRQSGEDPQKLDHHLKLAT